MQTLKVLLKDSIRKAKSTAKTVISVVFCCGIVLSLSACNNVRIDQKALEQSSAKSSLCASAYRIAQKNQKYIDVNISSNDTENANNASNDTENSAKSKNTVKNNTENTAKKSANNSANNSDNNASNNASSETEKSAQLNYSLLKQTAKAWQIVAEQCPSRFAEGIVKSTQITVKLIQNNSDFAKEFAEEFTKDFSENLSKDFAEDSSNNSSENSSEEFAENPENSKNKSDDSDSKKSYASQTPSDRLTRVADEAETHMFEAIRKFAHDHESLRLTHAPIARAALGEDQLAFILQTLASNQKDRDLFKKGENAASISDTFMHFAGKGKDIRKKTYDFPFESLDSQKAKDTATGKNLKVEAIVYMDCARTELAALNENFAFTGYDAKSEIPEADYDYANSDNSSNLDNSSKSSKTADSSHKPGSHKSDSSSVNLKKSSIKEVNNELHNILAKLVISRLLRAYSMGYPTDVSAILAK